MFNNIFEKVYSKYGYNNARAYNDYVLSENDVFNEIDDNRPLVFNMANGYYSNHSVTVYGYKEYDGPHWYSYNKEFFKVHDGWTNDSRYIDWDAWGTFGSFTKSAPYGF